MNVLIVEDESLVAMEIGTFVQTLGYTVCATASSGEKALEYFTAQRVDVVLMDVYLKGEMDGIACAMQMCSLKEVPLIYISAFSDDETLERAISTHPDAYLVKPFHRDELKMAMKIALKSKQLTAQKLHRGDKVLDEEFSYDTHTHELIYQEERLHLTKLEQQLLELLLATKHGLLSIDEMENSLWPDRPSNENRRRALVSRLRAKLHYRFIQTIHAEGYTLYLDGH